MVGQNGGIGRSKTMKCSDDGMDRINIPQMSEKPKLVTDLKAE